MRKYLKYRNVKTIIHKTEKQKDSCDYDYSTESR
jgi:hypothetical protein